MVCWYLSYKLKLNICFKAEVEHLFQSEQTAEESQRDPQEVTAEDTFIESHPEHLKVWNEVQDNFLLEVLDAALNCIPV